MIRVLATVINITWTRVYKFARLQEDEFVLQPFLHLYLVNSTIASVTDEFNMNSSQKFKRLCSIQFQLVMAHMLTSKQMFDSSLCADQKLKHPSWWQSISRPILFCKYFISQFIDTWSWFVLLVQRANELNSGNHRSAFKESDGNSPKSRISVNLPVFFSSVWNAFFCWLPTESQPDIAFKTRSKKHIYKQYSDVNECIGANGFSLPVTVLN